MTLSADEIALAKQSNDMYRNRWKKKGAKRASEMGFNICIGFLEQGRSKKVPQIKKREYMDYFQRLAREESK